VMIRSIRNVIEESSSYLYIVQTPALNPIFTNTKTLKAQEKK